MTQPLQSLWTYPYIYSRSTQNLLRFHPNQLDIWPHTRRVTHQFESACYWYPPFSSWVRRALAYIRSVSVQRRSKGLRHGADHSTTNLTAYQNLSWRKKWQSGVKRWFQSRHLLLFDKLSCLVHLFVEKELKLHIKEGEGWDLARQVVASQQLVIKMIYEDRFGICRGFPSGGGRKCAMSRS